MKKVALVDGEKLFVEGISKILEQQSDLKVIDTFSDGQQLLDALNSLKTHPDLIIMDLKMKGLNGVEIAKTLKAEYPNIKLIILSSHYTPSFSRYLHNYDINSFVPKNISKENFLEVVSNVIKEGYYFLPEYYTFLNSEPIRKQSSILNIPEKLTKKEVEVLRYICHGYTNQEIADKLYKSIRTIEGHRQKIIDKTGAKNTAGIVVFAIMNKLVDIEKRLLNYHVEPIWLNAYVA